jgi:hypothetical protein
MLMYAREMPSQVEDFGSGRRFKYLVAGGAAVLFAGVLWLRFSYELPMPPLPPRPSAASAQALRSLDYSQNLYRALLDKDAQELGVSRPGAEMELPFDYDLSEPHRNLLAGGAPFETRDLLLTAKVDRVAARFTNGSMVSDHLILRIENKTDHAVAYRVETKPPIDPRVCLDKGDLGHDAIALAPHAVAERTECPARNGSVTSLTVLRVETLGIPMLSFYYVSRLHPAHIGLDVRTTRGHTPPKGAICADIPEQAIRRAMEKGETSWRDVIDFYARENCEKYLFVAGYRAFTKPSERPLPAQPGPAGAAP